MKTVHQVIRHYQKKIGKLGREYELGGGSKEYYERIEIVLKEWRNFVSILQQLEANERMKSTNTYKKP